MSPPLPLCPSHLELSVPLQVQIQSQKVDISKVSSKCGSKANIKHKPGEWDLRTGGALPVGVVCPLCLHPCSLFAFLCSTGIEPRASC